MYNYKNLTFATIIPDVVSNLINSQIFLFRSQTTAIIRNAPLSILKIATVLSLPKYGC